MAESLSVNNLTGQIAREEILNNQRRESFKSYNILLNQFHLSGTSFILVTTLLAG